MYYGDSYIVNMPRKGPSSSQYQSQSRIPQTQDDTQLTQLTLTGLVNGETVNIDDQVNDCVRYILQKASYKLPFRKSELQKNAITGSSRNFEAIIQKARQILRDVYGFNLLLCDGSGANRTYVLSNALPYLNEDTAENSEEPPEDIVKVLLLLILSHIFMSNDAVGEASLHSFLLNLEIDIDRRHAVFGNVKDHLYTMIKQKYLQLENDPTTKKSSYAWGARANAEISKQSVLKFVCKIYKESKPEAWANHFEQAEQQGFGNVPLPNETGNTDMEVNE